MPRGGIYDEEDSKLTEIFQASSGKKNRSKPTSKNSNPKDSKKSSTQILNNSGSRQGDARTSR